MQLNRSWHALTVGLALVVATACAQAAPAAAPAQRPAPATDGSSGAQVAPPSTTEALATYDGPDRQQILEAGARQEGKLTWYTSSIRETIGQPMMTAFQQKYPFLQVEYYRADGNELRQRAREEMRAGRRVADIFETTMAAVQLAMADGFFQAYRSPSARDYPSDTVQSQGYWVVTRELYPAIGFNTNAIRPEDAPRSYEDFLDPKWKGRIALPSGDIPVSFVGLMVETRGEAFLEQLGRQDIRSREVSQTALANLIASGEVVLTPAMTSKDARALQAKGAPIGWNPAKPISPQRAAVALVKSAPHPHAALLMIDFMLSRAESEGQDVYEKQTYGSPGRGEGLQYELVDISVRPDIGERWEYWERLLNQHIVRPGQ